MQHTTVLNKGLDHPVPADQHTCDAGDDAAASTTSELVARANLGDQSAWNRLVGRYAGMVWAIARAHGLGRDDAADVSQITWLLLTQHLGSLRQPEELGGWLHATAMREAFRMCRLRGPKVPDPS
jgi:DNA-directed RNA polymerase specialized sigma24 family protein